ncbi:MAG: hypothetical protein ACI9FU_000239 [Granulosicoccus sp.]|jgi:hypothetical protein
MFGKVSLILCGYLHGTGLKVDTTATMMKSIRILSTLILIMSMTLSTALSQHGERIDAAIRVGNSSALSEHFGPKVDLTLLSKEDSYSKAQAEQILKDFFQKNSVSDYKVIHHGSAKDGAEYFIGSLTTSGGSFRTYLLVRTENSKKRIQQLRIEASE